MESTIHEECGIFGIYDDTGHCDVALDTYYGLFSLQHRGQESCGIAVNDRGVISYHKKVGLVRDVFTKEEITKLGPGQIAIGHTRYSTFGTVNDTNAQPLVVRHVKGQMALAHNGNLTNAPELRRNLEMQGAIFHTTNDSEIIAYEIIRERLKCASIEDAVCQAMYNLAGAYSLVIMSPEKLIAVRDPNGFRPLVMGRMKEGQIVFASETCALDALGASFIRNLDAGEIVVVGREGIHSIRTHVQPVKHMCVFEFVYFARPDSVMEGVSVHDARIRAGRILAQEHPADADVVTGVPDSGLAAAEGYALESGIPFALAFHKNSYIGRSFIKPTDEERRTAVHMKLSVMKSVVKDKRIVIIDDSIVRGTTMKQLIEMLRSAGAKEVHVRISSPPFLYPCYYGTDVPTASQLIASEHSKEDVCRNVGADSLEYLAVDDFAAMVNDLPICTACFTNEYPVK